MRYMLDLFPEDRIRPDPLPYNMLRQTKGMQGDGDMAGATEMTEAGAPGAGKARGHLLAGATVLVWGITFVSTKVLLTVASPIEILFLRFALGFCALCILHRKVTPFMGWRTEALFAAAGATGVTLYFFMENIALTMTSASNVGVIVAVSPLFIALIASFVTREERVGGRFFAGFALAIGGIALISFEGAEAGGLGLEGCLLALLAAVAWAIYSTLVRRIERLGLPVVASTKRTFLWGLVFMLPFLPIMGFGKGAAGAGLAGMLDPVMLANLAFLGFVASAACYATWSAAARIIGVVSTSAYIYLVPVVTVACSVAVLGEPLTWRIVLGVALTIVGLFLSERRGANS